MASDMPPGQPVPPNHWRAHVPTAHICADADDGFKHLQAHVATTAFDSDDYADAPKCHPNTRIAVLDDIMHWIAIQAATRTQWVLWLNGAAGAGKSAIGRSIVALCLAQDVPVARFFFFRTDAARNGPKPVVATLAYQLMESIPELRSIVIPRIQADALVFTKSLETQFRALVFGPLLQLQSGSSLQQKTVVLLLDGVDECVGYDKQAQIIRIIADFVKTQAFPLVAFFGSRAETQLCAEFRAPARAGVLLQLALDTDYRADGDIRHFLTDSFATIRSTHPFRRALRDSNWPDHAAVDDLVHRASGQFIYASVALNFISAANQDPARLLAVVRGLRPSGKLTPFAQLDALYRHIFSQVADIHAASLVLAWDMFTVKDDGALSVGTDPVFGTMDNTDIKVALADLTSVLTYTTDRRIKFLHASLPDFLLDPKRSQIYHIDRATWSAQLSIVTLRRIIHMEPSRQAAGAVQWQNNHKVAELHFGFRHDDGIVPAARKAHCRTKRTCGCPAARYTPAEFRTRHPAHKSQNPRRRIRPAASVLPRNNSEMGKQSTTFLSCPQR
ncbi:hypothetical protein HYPSUDRAFT_31437 [Hypholoma sublateritium FD-334 SS-4]|uniref:Nephrocystin 3-like N-terminal domain-containing protein n=1 Tax=Hypholoma sublateritium (strain FD-334 SS-4) TaxID=945553 RepID=A0A0D2MZF3_HYPSF|nr:hypothetical protein HYPSUDRAFT_31437 [Hypholoma sublateritium FD-334 SS-4]